MPSDAGREDELGAERAQQGAALLRHGLRHRQDDVVAAGRADERERDARVAAGGLDDRAAGLELAGRLGGVDDRDADAVLDRVGRVVELELADDGRGGSVGDLVDADQRGVADERRRVVVDACHGSSSVEPPQSRRWVGTDESAPGHRVSRVLRGSVDSARCAVLTLGRALGRAGHPGQGILARGKDQRSTDSDNRWAPRRRAGGRAGAAVCARIASSMTELVGWRYPTGRDRNRADASVNAGGCAKTPHQADEFARSLGAGRGAAVSARSGRTGLCSTSQNGTATGPRATASAATTPTSCERVHAPFAHVFWTRARNRCNVLGDRSPGLHGGVSIPSRTTGPEVIRAATRVADEH